MVKLWQFGFRLMETKLFRQDQDLKDFVPRVLTPVFDLLSFDCPLNEPTCVVSNALSQRKSTFRDIT